jgi:uncharacterized protein YkwD
MNETARHNPSRGAAVGPAVLLLAALAGCAGAGASGRGGPAASIAGGKFTPGAPPAANYGADPLRKCASNQISDAVQESVAKAAAIAGKPAPRTDGRLCAMADSLMSWDENEPVPEPLNQFLTRYFGMVQPVPRVIVSQFPPVSELDAADKIAESIADYVGTASNVQYGLATQKIQQTSGDRRQATYGTQQPVPIKVALVMQDPTLELDPLPRKLDPSGQATVKGKLLGGLQNAKVLISDTRGKLQQPPEQKTKDFSAPIACEGRTGRIVVEIRGEDQGSPRALADLPVLCGIDPPTSVELASSEPADPAQQERAIFDRINRERTGAGLAPLTWYDRVAQVARAASQSEAQAATGGGTVISGQELAQRLRQTGVSSAVIMQNPGQGRTAAGAHDRFELSPVHRANYMSTDATHGGVGVALYTARNAQVAMVNELFVRELAAVDIATLGPKLRQAIAKNRAAAGAPAFNDDPTLEKVAAEYAKELAAAAGNISNARHSQLVTPLYRSFRTVDLLTGAKGDPLEFADEKTVLTSKEKLIGLGLAQGNHPTLGQNAVYVVLLFGTKK